MYLKVTILGVTQVFGGATINIFRAIMVERLRSKESAKYL